MLPGDIILSPSFPKTLRELRVPAAILVGVVWTAAFSFGLLTQSYVALGATTPIVMLVAGAIFTFKNGNGNDDAKEADKRPWLKP